MMKLNSPYSAVDPLPQSDCLLLTPFIITLPQMTQITAPAPRIISAQPGLNTQVIVSGEIPSVKPDVYMQERN